MADLLEDLGQAELFDAGDRLRDQAQHHGGPQQRFQQVDSHPDKVKAKGAVELLVAAKAIDLGGAEQFLQPAGKGGGIGGGPFRALDVAAAAKTGPFPHAEVHIGIALSVGLAHNFFKAGACRQASDGSLLSVGMSGRYGSGRQGRGRRRSGW